MLTRGFSAVAELLVIYVMLHFIGIKRQYNVHGERRLLTDSVNAVTMH